MKGGCKVVMVHFSVIKNEHVCCRLPVCVLIFVWLVVGGATSDRKRIWHIIVQYYRILNDSSFIFIHNTV